MRSTTGSKDLGAPSSLMLQEVGSEAVLLTVDRCEHEKLSVVREAALNSVRSYSAPHLQATSEMFIPEDGQRAQWFPQRSRWQLLTLPT
jgi:hypothetical protein